MTGLQCLGAIRRMEDEVKKEHAGNFHHGFREDKKHET